MLPLPLSRVNTHSSTHPDQLRAWIPAAEGGGGEKRRNWRRLSAVHHTYKKQEKKLVKVESILNFLKKNNNMDFFQLSYDDRLSDDFTAT